MFVNNNFLNTENTRRMGVSVLSAIILHTFILMWFSSASSQKIIESDMLSVPTSVSIRFLNPVISEPKPVQKMVKVEPKIVKKMPVKQVAKVIPPQIIEKAQPQEFNEIEPAAFQPVEKVEKPIQKVIPVVSDKKLKGRRVQPKYPDRALRMKQEGTVWLRVLISETGTRQEIKIYKPTKYALLNQAAMKAVKKWTFAPNIVNGRPTKSWVEIPVEFKIQ